MEAIKLANDQIHIKIDEKQKKELFSLATNKLGFDNFSQCIKALPDLMSELSISRQINELTDFFQAELDKKFPVNQLKILHYLFCKKGSGLTARELADQMGKIPPQVARDIEKLLGKGFITSETKNCVTTYKLTVQGLSVAEQVWGVFVAFNLNHTYKKSDKNAWMWALESLQLFDEQAGWVSGKV